jgi:hypothetical protein
MQKLLKRVEAFVEPVRRRWNEQGVSRSRATDPVLRAAELAGLLTGAAARLEQNLVHLPNETERKRKSLSQSLQTMLHRRDVI